MEQWSVLTSSWRSNRRKSLIQQRIRDFLQITLIVHSRHQSHSHHQSSRHFSLHPKTCLRTRVLCRREASSSRLSRRSSPVKHFRAKLTWISFRSLVGSFRTAIFIIHFKSSYNNRICKCHNSIPSSPRYSESRLKSKVEPLTSTPNNSSTLSSPTLNSTTIPSSSSSRYHSLLRKCSTSNTRTSWLHSKSYLWSTKFNLISVTQASLSTTRPISTARSATSSHSCSRSSIAT